MKEILGDIDALLRDIDPDIIAAAEEVDVTLIDWLLSLSPLERVAWTQRQASILAGLKRVED